MSGMFGLGLGIGVGWAVATNGGPTLPVWLLLALGFWLVYRAGRRRRPAVAAVAVATAEATAVAAQQQAQAVNVFVAAPGAGARRWEGLDSVSWLSGQPDMSLRPDQYRALESGDVDPDALDDLDPVEAADRVRRGVASQ